MRERFSGGRFQKRWDEDRSYLRIKDDVIFQNLNTVEARTFYYKIDIFKIYNAFALSSKI